MIFYKISFMKLISLATIILSKDLWVRVRLFYIFCYIILNRPLKYDIRYDLHPLYKEKEMSLFFMENLYVKYNLSVL